MPFGHVVCAGGEHDARLANENKARVAVMPHIGASKVACAPLAARCGGFALLRSAKSPDRRSGGTWKSGHRLKTLGLHSGGS